VTQRISHLNSVTVHL